MLFFTALYLGLGTIVVALVTALVRETATAVVPDRTATPNGSAPGHV
jgi:hypothetical protein